MRLTFVMLVAVVLAGCKQQPSQQPKISDAELQRMHREMPGMTAECLDKLKWGGIEAIPGKEEDCFKFTPRRRMQGLWRNNFEGSEYCDGLLGQCPDPKANSESGIWLEMREPLAGSEDTPPGGLYAIDFVGRRSIGAGLFGGMAKNEVIVDRLLSIKEVEPPPPQHWDEIDKAEADRIIKGHIERYLKECAGKPICMPNSEIHKEK